MPKINAQPDIEKPWRLDHCPDCGYSLEGSTESGIRPESGLLLEEFAFKRSA